MADKKTPAEILKEQLCNTPKNSGILFSDEELDRAYLFCEGYKSYLNLVKTEREAVDVSIDIAREKGYKAFDANKKYQAGDKVYLNVYGKALILCTFGTEPLTEGVRIIASHIDCPRLDLKPNALYEDNEIALFKTHYYGGIKKYQWTAIPLALHGVLMTKDGNKITVTIGEDESDPVFVITDLLPHLAAEQMKRPSAELIKGEELNVIVGGRMFRDDKASERVKLAVLKLFNEKYGIVESDFLSAELSLVPAYKATDVGIDRSFLGSYGHDDRVCAYTSLIAEINAKTPKLTTVTVFADKEETGSNGCTGLDSKMLEYFIEDIGAPHSIPARKILKNSLCLSADVSAALDPTFPDVLEKNNASRMNYGTVITKYTGSRGKSSTNDASAEVTGYVRNLLDNASVQWQMGELGKVDLGGGGTVAKFISELGVGTIDIGVPVFSMHAPMEIVAKSDVYQTFRAFEEFLK